MRDSRHHRFLHDRLNEVEHAMKSPCIRICEIESRAGLCLGCGRTLGEIAGWAGFSDHERDAILTILPQRMERLKNGAQFPEVSRP